MRKVRFLDVLRWRIRFTSLTLKSLRIVSGSISLKLLVNTLSKNVSHVSQIATQSTTHPSTTRGARCDTFCPARRQHIFYNTCDTFLIGSFGNAYFDIFFNLITCPLIFSKTQSHQIMRSAWLGIGSIPIIPSSVVLPGPWTGIAFPWLTSNQETIKKKSMSLKFIVYGFNDGAYMPVVCS